jgi:hypothetical protein
LIIVISPPFLENLVPVGENGALVVWAVPIDHSLCHDGKKLMDRPPILLFFKTRNLLLESILRMILYYFISILTDGI